MKTYTEHEDYRITVIPLQPGNYGYVSLGRQKRSHDKWVAMMEKISAQIKRHVDNIESVHLEWDDIERCVYCDYEWEEDPETGEPYCCNKAVDEWESKIDKEDK